jgi:hypothetical protein
LKIESERFSQIRHVIASEATKQSSLSIHEQRWIASRNSQ